MVSLSRKVVASDLAFDGMQMTSLKGWLRLLGSTPVSGVTKVSREKMVRLRLRSNILT